MGQYRKPRELSGYFDADVSHVLTSWGVPGGGGRIVPPGPVPSGAERPEEKIKKYFDKYKPFRYKQLKLFEHELFKSD